MSKKKKFLLFFGGSVLLVIVVVGVISAIIFGSLLYLKPAETGEISGVYIIKDRNVNMFLLEFSDGYIAIDVGQNKTNIKEELNRLNIDESEIKYVLLTHSHGDHVGALGLFENAQIYMSEDELQMISNSLPDGINTESINLLKDEELLLGERKIKCVKTPGHTLGAMTYLIDDNYLFTGDAVEISKETLKIHINTMDTKKAHESIEVIKNVIETCEYVFTSHYGYYKPADLNLK